MGEKKGVSYVRITAKLPHDANLYPTEAEEGEGENFRAFDVMYPAFLSPWSSNEEISTKIEGARSSGQTREVG